MIIEFFPPAHGGAGKQALTLAKALRREGIDCEFISLDWGNSPKFKYMEGFRVIRFNTVKPVRWHYLLFVLQIVLRLIKERANYDIVHFHSIWPFSFLVFAVCKLLKKPVIVKLTLLGHDDPRSLRKNSFLWRVEGSFLKYADRIICLSTALKRSCLNAGIPLSRLASIPNGVDTTIFTSISSKEKKILRRSLKLPDDAIIVSFIGRVCLRKGCDLLFDAWDELLKNNSKTMLLMIGPYETKDNFPQKENMFGLRLKKLTENSSSKNIIFLGQRHSVADYLRASDIFAFPSRAEGFPSAVIEAMACGLPVIALRIKGLTKDLIEHGKDGIIVEKPEASYLAREIIHLIDNIELRKQLSENAIRKARSQFSINLVAKQYKDLYENLLT